MKKKRLKARSLIEFVRLYGIDEARKISASNTIKYKDTLNRLNQSGDYKVIDVIDNQTTPEKSISCKCQMPGCGKNIRYEFVMQDAKGERTVVGSSCIKTLTNFSDSKISELINIPKDLKKEQEEIDKQKKWLNSYTYINGKAVLVSKIIDKLDELAKTELAIFLLLSEFVHDYHKILTDDDLRFIWFSNKEKTLHNALIYNKVEILLKRAEKYNNDKGLIKRLTEYKKSLNTNIALYKDQEEYVVNYRYDDRPFGSCPLCGGKLVKRAGKFGEFIGCENFQMLDCKYTKDINK